MAASKPLVRKRPWPKKVEISQREGFRTNDSINRRLSIKYNYGTYIFYEDGGRNMCKANKGAMGRGEANVE